MFNFASKKNKKPIQKKSGSSKNPKILEVNLIKDEIQIVFDWSQHLGTLFFALLVTVLFVVEIYFGLNWWNSYESERVLASEEKFSQVSQDIRALKTESDEMLAFKKRADIADSLLSNHIYWTNFLTWLEKNTLSTITYAGISGKSDGIYSLAATANAFREVSWQTRAFMADSSVISVKVNSASLQQSDDSEFDTGESAVSFNLDLEVDPQVFKINLE